MSYEEQLKSKEWYYVKTLILDRDNYRCTECRTDRRELHVHHTYYTAGKKAWEYPYSSLVTLCDQCHASKHGIGDPVHELDIALARLVHVAGYGVRSWCQNQFPKEEDGTPIH
jgi:hypothetical protein